jgi:hypothetical protein
MEGKILFANYQNFSLDDLKKLPAEELAIAFYDLLQAWGKLNQKANQDSTNSHRSPSTDSPEAKAKRKAEDKAAPTKHGTRKQGAQPGHQAVVQPFVPIEEVETIKDYKPDHCEHCGHSLEGVPDDPNPYRKQFFDFEIIVHVEEIRQHTLTCPNCGQTTKGTLPEKAQETIYSANVAALVGVLTGLYQISRRMAAMFIREVLRKNTDQRRKRIEHRKGIDGKRSSCDGRDTDSGAKRGARQRG